MLPAITTVDATAVLAQSEPAATKTATATPSASAHVGKPNVAIAAQVGDEAISSVDVENRIKFIITTSHLSNTPDVIQNIRPHVVRSLVDEKLQLQEAKKNDIKITDKDINEAIAGIEKQRGMPPGGIFKMLAEDNVPKETFIQQIQAQLSWNHLLLKKIRPQVRVSDEEINLASNRILAEPTPKETTVLPHEYKIGVISLPIDKPSRENEVRHLGEKLVKEIRSGASFEEVSRHFSSTTASAGGKVETFWVTLEQVDPHIAAALRGAKEEAIIDPVRTDEGYTIIKVYETRGIAETKPAKLAVKTPAATNNPTANNDASKDVPKPASAEKPKEVDEKAANRERIYGMLVQQKMELEAQKYLRNLRRETFIDIR